MKEQLARLTGDAPPAPAGPVAVLADPKDKVEILERYRQALAFMAERKWARMRFRCFSESCEVEPRPTEVWKELAQVALLLNRHDVALDAYRHLIELEPAEPLGFLGAAEVLLKERRIGRGAYARAGSRGARDGHDPATLPHAAPRMRWWRASPWRSATRTAPGSRPPCPAGRLGTCHAGVRRGTDSLRRG